MNCGKTALELAEQAQCDEQIMTLLTEHYGKAQAEKAAMEAEKKQKRAEAAVKRKAERGANGGTPPKTKKRQTRKRQSLPKKKQIKTKRRRKVAMILNLLLLLREIPWRVPPVIRQWNQRPRMKKTTKLRIVKTTTKRHLPRPRARWEWRS
mmetsp:Transcript_5706/g.16068  ORF Transcript_5706/g.16068 Transcript_5706/m.16068 type:complete len:151 (-) Transcript_5706:972-1424(-)